MKYVNITDLIASALVLLVFSELLLGIYQDLNKIITSEAEHLARIVLILLIIKLKDKNVESLLQF